MIRDQSTMGDINSPELDEGKREWTVEIILPDNEGVSFYLERYRPFRLFSLQESPEGRGLCCVFYFSFMRHNARGFRADINWLCWIAFSSTYEREINMTDGDWARRVASHLATTFVVVDDRDRTVLSAATLQGPLPAPNGLVTNKATDSGGTLFWSINAVYTLPEVRKKGLARRVLNRVLQVAKERGDVQGANTVITLAVHKGGVGARALYESCGFSMYNENEEEFEMVLRLSKV